LSGLQTLIDVYQSNPVLKAVIDIKARESANMKVVVENIKNGEIEPIDTRKDIPAAIYRLFQKPNPIKTTWDFWFERKVLREATGNSFTYANFPTSFGKSPTNIKTLFNAWPQFMEFKLAGKFFEATEIDEIVKEWVFKMGDYKKTWTPDQVLHQSEPSTSPTFDKLIIGHAKALSLIKPLTNIDMAYESRNVIIKGRGMRGIISSGKGDMDGTIPLLEDEKELVEKAMEKYGTLEEQIQFLFSSVPLKYQAIDQDVRKLGLFEEIATDGMIIANVFGVPEILLKLYLEGATFENQEASLRRLYQGTLIPEAENDLAGLNDFLGLNQTDWRIKGYWDHIPALQKSEKDKAESNQRISIYSLSLFKAGAITLNTWLDSIGMKPIKQPYADQTIVEMDEATRTLILESLKGGSLNTGEANAGAETNSGSGAKSLNGHLKDTILN
jgi:hypothetical protein